MFNQEHIENLILKALTGNLSEEEQRELQQLLAESAEARNRYEQLNSMSKGPEVEASLQRLSTFSFPPVNEEKRRRRVIRLMKRSAGIAALLITFIGGYIYFAGIKSPVKVTADKHKNIDQVQLKVGNGPAISLSGNQTLTAEQAVFTSQNKTLSFQLQSGSSMSSQLATLSVPNGKDFTIKLPDGTQVQLNAGSKLVFPLSFAKNSRNISIQGEAYLDIAQDAARPFQVALSSNITVQVLGTAFNINNYDSLHTSVSLVKGAVRVKLLDNSVLLKPGMAATATKDQLKSYPFDTEDVLSWRNGVLKLNESTLGAVFKELPRWYGASVVVQDNSLNKLAFTGELDRNKGIGALLEGLKYSHNIDYYKKQDTIYIKRAN